MAKGKKLILADLKVKSFVTESDREKESKIKGGCAPSVVGSGCIDNPQTKTGVLVCCWFEITDPEC